MVRAVRELEPYIDRDHLPADPLLKMRQPPRTPERPAWPAEVTASRRDPEFWLANMIGDHRYSWEEAAKVFGWTIVETKAKAAELKILRLPEVKQELVT